MSLVSMVFTQSIILLPTFVHIDFLSCNLICGANGHEASLYTFLLTNSHNKCNDIIHITLTIEYQNS